MSDKCFVDEYGFTESKFYQLHMVGNYTPDGNSEGCGRELSSGCVVTSHWEQMSIQHLFHVGST
jgi:hypothetical protein